jgi:WD40 repeat protein
LARIPQQLVDTVAFSPDGHRLITGADDGSLRVWDPRTRRQLDARTGHLGSVIDLAFSPDGATLATSSSDGTVRFWDGHTLEPIMTIAADAQGKLAFSPDGARIAYTADDGIVRVLALDIDHLVGLARARLTRSWTQDECRTYLHVETCPPSVT